MNEIEDRDIEEKITSKFVFEKISKSDKHLDMLTKKKTEDTYYQ